MFEPRLSVGDPGWGMGGGEGRGRGIGGSCLLRAFGPIFLIPIFLILIAEFDRSHSFI